MDDLGLKTLFSETSIFKEPSKVLPKSPKCSFNHQLQWVQAVKFHVQQTYFPSRMASGALPQLCLSICLAPERQERKNSHESFVAILPPLQQKSLLSNRLSSNFWKKLYKSLVLQIWFELSWQEQIETYIIYPSISHLEYYLSKKQNCTNTNSGDFSGSFWRLLLLLLLLLLTLNLSFLYFFTSSSSRNASFMNQSNSSPPTRIAGRHCNCWTP